MTYSTNQFSYENKIEFYNLLNQELQYHLDQHWLTNLSQVSALVFDQLPQVNWVGFYLLYKNELILGPYQGKPACMRISLGRGVCGTAAKNKKAILVANVDEFPGHIACDSASKSEVVIPLIVGGEVIGVFDVDSPQLNRFDQQDVDGLSLIIKTFLEKTVLPISLV